MHKKKIVFKGYSKRDILVTAVFTTVFYSVIIFFSALNKISGLYIVGKNHLGKAVWDFSFIATPTFAIITLTVGTMVMISHIKTKNE